MPTPLEIKTNAIKRLVKDAALYEDEIQEYTAKVNRLRAENGDPYELKKMEAVLADTKQMIPELHNKVRATLESLQAQIKDGGDEAALEAVAAAKGLLKE